MNVVPMSIAMIGPKDGTKESLAIGGSTTVATETDEVPVSISIEKPPHPNNWVWAILRYGVREVETNGIALWQVFARPWTSIVQRCLLLLRLLIIVRGSVLIWPGERYRSGKPIVATHGTQWYTYIPAPKIIECSFHGCTERAFHKN